MFGRKNVQFTPGSMGGKGDSELLEHFILEEAIGLVKSCSSRRSSNESIHVYTLELRNSTQILRYHLGFILV